MGGVWLLLSSHPLPFCWGCAPEPGFREHLFLASSHLCIFFPHRYYFFNNENNELGASIASLQPPMMMCGMSPGSRFLLPACMGMERGAQGQHLLGWGSHRGGCSWLGEAGLGSVPIYAAAWCGFTHHLSHLQRCLVGRLLLRSVSWAPGPKPGPGEGGE